MAYATVDYYKTTYKGTIVTDAEIEQQLERASDVLDVISGYNIENLTPFQGGLVKKACCAQAESQIMGADDIQSASIGSFSYTLKSGGRVYITEKAMQLIEAAGLLYRGLCVR